MHITFVILLKKIKKRNNKWICLYFTFGRHLPSLLLLLSGFPVYTLLQQRTTTPQSTVFKIYNWVCVYDTQPRVVSPLLLVGWLVVRSVVRWSFVANQSHIDSALIKWALRIVKLTGSHWLRSDVIWQCQIDSSPMLLAGHRRGGWGHTLMTSFLWCIWPCIYPWHCQIVYSVCTLV